jgi:hypothetical protein
MGFVNEIQKEIKTVPDSQNNELIKLYRKADSVEIITTNFMKSTPRGSIPGGLLFTGNRKKKSD